ncbi:hypothetical protein O3M35_012875 [Rhynocoris fuscipes]|uniref:Glucose-methanol-choline oxidoreductase N-terminal domain-containing protein n=1 Tax=Rhynocoris fuscipes TaxID=488301 RepID=A0AAW1CEE7_9HEMI
MLDLNGVLAALFIYLGLYFPQELDPSLKPKDSSALLTKFEFDFIIVGAGSAGCVLANRLSANPDWSVLLIEAGGDETYLTDTPALHNALFNTEVDWNYTTVRQKRACKDRDGMCLYPRGHVLGGSSAINGMIYSRGNPQDYEEWEQMGNPGWGFNEVFKYYQKLENMTDHHLAHSPLHSVWGEQPVGFSRYRAKIYEDILQAGFHYGLDEVDYNGHNQIGISYAQLTIDGATRASTSKAYLNPIRYRHNLYIFKNTIVTKVLINKSTRTAVGVRCLTAGQLYNVYAKKEVILSAGAVNSPQILMLSGIGPKEHLMHFGIPLIADLPVGKNLMDHNCVRINFYMNCNNDECLKHYGKKIALNYAKHRKGELTSNFMEMVAFLNKLRIKHLPPDIQYHFALGNDIYKETDQACLSMLVTNLSPKSRGTIKLRSKNPLDPPMIDPNYYGRIEDLKMTMWGVKEAFRLLNAPSMRKYELTLIANQSCAHYQDETSFLICFIEYQTGTIFHPSGTTKMGSIFDRTTVVNSELKVHTINNLRVVDAGIMPKITRGNTNAPTIMIAEKASDIIIEEYTYHHQHHYDSSSHEDHYDFFSYFDYL